MEKNLKLAKMIVIISMFSAVTVSLVLASYAWFASSERVDANNSAIESSESASVLIIDFDQEMEELKADYNGQTGNTPPGTEDAPYMLTRRFNLSIATLAESTEMQIDFHTLILTTRTDEVTDIAAEGAYNKFTWRTTITAEDGTEKVYYPAESGSACLRSGYSALGDGENLTVTSGVYDITLSVIFLSESDYKLWENGEYQQITPFAYSDYAYMRSHFEIAMQISIIGSTDAEASIEEGA